MPPKKTIKKNTKKKNTKSKKPPTSPNSSKKTLWEEISKFGKIVDSILCDPKFFTERLDRALHLSSALPSIQQGFALLTPQSVDECEVFSHWDLALNADESLLADPDRTKRKLQKVIDGFWKVEIDRIRQGNRKFPFIAAHLIAFPA